MDRQAFQRYLGVVRRWWWLMILGFLLPMVVSFFLASRQPNLYQAQATVMVGSSLQSPSPNPNIVNMSSQLARAYAQLVERRTVTEAVIQRLDLDMSPERLTKQITVQVQPQLQLIEILVTDSNPQWAAAIANALAVELVQRSPTSQQDEARREFSERQLVELQQKIEEVSANLAEQQNTLSSLTSAVEVADAEERIAALDRVLASYQAIYASLLQSLGSEQTPNTLTIIEPATVPIVPVPQKTWLMVAVAGMAGLALAFGGVVLLEYLDDHIRWEGPTQETVLGLPVLGAVSRLSAREGPLVIRKLPGSPEAEAIRELRTSILLAAGTPPLKVMLLTSAEPQEGKSLIAANLAVAMAELGRRTLLIDADLRKRQLHQVFALPKDQGLIELLTDSRPEPGTFVQQTPVPNLCLLPAGKQPCDPTSLLTSSRFARLLEKLKSEYDLILVDSPAAFAVPDATIVATLADATILIVDAKTTSRRAAVRTKGRLEGLGRSAILGVIINRANLDRRGRRGYYY